MKVFFVFFLLIFGTIWGLFAQELNLTTHVFVSSLENSSAPQYHAESNSILFTYKALENHIHPQFVAISFAQENFAILNTMQFIDTVDLDGNLLSRVYYYLLPIQDRKETTILYRYVVDGAWLEDPKNPDYIQKINGSKISRTVILEIQIPIANPRIESEVDIRTRKVHFVYFAETQEQVYLAGNFNNWDPFMYQFQESRTEPGRYEVTIRLLPGDYHYSFYYKGRRIKDPFNLNSSYDIEGYEYSFFSIEPS